MALFAHRGELSIPPTAKSDARALELARVWAAVGAQHVTLRAEAWPDPAAWGIVLVDLARHVARAYQETQGRPPDETLALIHEMFEAEWARPTDVGSGKIEE